MVHPRNEHEWRREVERKLAQHGSAVSHVYGQIIPAAEEVINGAIGKQPTAPIELVVQTSLYVNTHGEWRGRFTLDFPDVTVATDGSPVTVAWYELQGVNGGTFFPPQNTPPASVITETGAKARMHAPALKVGGRRWVDAPRASGTAKAVAPLVRAWDNTIEFAQMASSPTSSLRVDDLEPGSFWTFRARAHGVNAFTPGQWSDEVEVTILHDTLPPPQLTKPVATVTRGTITVTWDGKGVGGQLPADFVYAELAHGTDANPTEIVARFFGEGGFTVISDVPYYDPQFFRIRGVDESGNFGPWSQQEVAYVTPLVDVDVILSTIDAAKTMLINVDAGVSILSDTILTRHLVITEDMTVALLAAHKIVADDIEANAITADKILAGSITAVKLEADLALVSKIIAGDPNGTHAELDPLGFRVFAADETDGVPNEVVRMGVATSDDYFAITRSDGTLAATISQDGVGSFSQVHALDEFYYKGKRLTDVLATLPQGIVGAAYRDYQSAVNASPSGNIGFLRLEVPMIGGRIYRVATSPLRISRTGGSVLVGIKYDTLGSLATLASGSLTQSTVWDEVNAPVLQELFSVSTDRVVSFLLWMGVAGGDAGFRPTPSEPARLFVEDLGNAPYLIDQGVHIDGTAPGGTSRQTFFKQYPSWNSMNYQGSNAQYVYNLTQMYQGLSPAGYGNLKSISLHPDMTADLTGADINYIRVYFNFKHWHYNAGGTARIGVHGHTSIPGSFSHNGVVATSINWPKPGARWVELPSSVHAGFKSGAYRGVSLEGSSNYSTYGYADRPTIEISYNK